MLSLSLKFSLMRRQMIGGLNWMNWRNGPCAKLLLLLLLTRIVILSEFLVPVEMRNSHEVQKINETQHCHEPVEQVQLAPVERHLLETSNAML